MCIGLHTLPPCLLFCGNYILHESEYDVHIFCVALDIIIYPAALTPLGATPQTPFQKLYMFFDRLPLPADVVGSNFMFCFILLLSVFQHLGGCDFVQLSYKERACEKIYQHNGDKQSGT